MPPASPPDTTRDIILELDAQGLELACAALEGEAGRWRDAAVTLSAELEAARVAGDDIRTGSLRIVNVLAQAAALGRVAFLQMMKN